jgi:hypothetical protein
MVYLSASVPKYINYYFWKFYFVVSVLCTALSILLFNLLYRYSTSGAFSTEK